ncbi:response regulator transcription factor [Aquiluna sp. Uisw_065]|uniref:response regulator transcription factor n=1 Tax=Aquiluna sp. Uisw_065 TaxID=3230967 RepID=UPI0039EB17CD
MEILKVLVVDDEPNIRDLLSASLRFAGHQVATAANGTDAISMITETKPDIVLLDVMLPDISGFGVTKKIRAMGIEVPILFLTARDDTEDKITGLTVGGDDYVTKPFSLDEIMARISAIIRRTSKDGQDGALITVGELSINEDAHEVTVGAQVVELSPTEYQLLRYLATNPNRVLTKAQILDHVWEYDFNGEMGIVESYVSYLRKKLDPLSQEPLIITKRGVGYMLKGPKG